MASFEEVVRQHWPILKNRLAVLEDRKRLLEAQIRDLDIELEQARHEFEAIDTAAKTLRTNLSLDFQENESNQQNFNRIYQHGEVSIKQAARLTLNTFHGGLESHDLFNAINRRYFEGRLERTSFSPQLSRLKRDGEVKLGENGWVLTARGRQMMGTGPYLPYHDEPDTNGPPSA